MAAAPEYTEKQTGDGPCGLTPVFSIQRFQNESGSFMNDTVMLRVCRRRTSYEASASRSFR